MTTDHVPLVIFVFVLPELIELGRVHKVARIVLHLVPHSIEIKLQRKRLTMTCVNSWLHLIMLGATRPKTGLLIFVGHQGLEVLKLLGPDE